MMDHFRSSMGSHKHGISGVAGRPPGEKQRMARDANRRREQKRRMRQRQRPKMYPTLRSLFDHGEP